jgi:hypothetical protein
MTRVLGEVQRGLEALYRIEAAADVRDFVITDEARAVLGVGRAPREQLLLRQAEGELEVGLFVDELALARLERGVDGDNLEEFLLAVEGVSHFLYVMVRAREDRPFSALELELQAEVDKYLLALLAAWRPEHGAPPEGLRERLFERVSFHGDLSREERDRYAAANDAAAGYVASLEARFVRRRAVGEMLEEVRRFYRLGCAGKLDHITRKAA